MDEQEKVHVRFVVGGVYRRTLPGGQYLEGTLIGATLHGSGRRNGVIWTESQAPVSVVENAPTLDEWALVREPVDTDLLRTLETTWFHVVEQLKARIAALESLEFTKPEPTVAEVPKPADPLDELVKVSGRTLKSASAR